MFRFAFYWDKPFFSVKIPKHPVVFVVRRTKILVKSIPPLVCTKNCLRCTIIIRFETFRNSVYAFLIRTTIELRINNYVCRITTLGPLFVRCTDVGTPWCLRPKEKKTPKTIMIIIKRVARPGRRAPEARGAITNQNRETVMILRARKTRTRVTYARQPLL